MLERVRSLAGGDSTATHQAFEALQEIEYENLSDKIYDTLRERIELREFKGGERLDVDELTRRMGVSRTPVKDALSRLANEGFITIVPRRGTFVTSLTEKLVNDAYDLRLMFDLWAAEHVAAEISDKALVRLRDIWEKAHSIARLVDSEFNFPEFHEFYEEDAQFHRTLVEETGNKLVLKSYKSNLWICHLGRVHHVRKNAEHRQVDAEHEAILLACERRDTPKLVRATRDHIENSRSRVLGLLAEFGGSL